MDDNTSDSYKANEKQVSELKKLVSETIINSSRIIDLNATMLDLNVSLKAVADESRKAAQLSAAETRLSGIAEQRKGVLAGIDAGIGDIGQLAKSYGLQLQNAAGGAASFSTASGSFISDYAQIYGNSANFQPFKNEFYTAGGVYDRTYGQSDQLNTLNASLEAQRAIIRSLGGVPKFATGTNLIPQDMLALLHKGEAVVPAAYNPAAMPNWVEYGRGGTEVLCAEIKALRDEVTQLRAESRAGDQAIASATAKTAKILERVTPDGNSFQTVAAT